MDAPTISTQGESVMLRAVVAWLVLWSIFILLLKKLRVMKQNDANKWWQRALQALVAMVLASLALVGFVMVF
jgi:hypothetical protein